MAAFDLIMRLLGLKRRGMKTKTDKKSPQKKSTLNQRAVVTACDEDVLPDEANELDDRYPTEEAFLEGLRESLRDVMLGNVHPVSELDKPDNG
jgi:hypothetical protein